MPRGRTEPRIYTPPLRELTEETSYGYDVIWFARHVLDAPLDPWQEWLVIHLGELLEDGRPRFRNVLVIVARQSGKTHLAAVLILFWLFVERQRMVLATSTTLGMAKEAWTRAIDLAEGSPDLAENFWLRKAAGEETFHTKDGCRYRIAASNRRGGRGLTIDRLVLDELREHQDWSAWDAAVPAMNARPHAQAVAISNAADDTGVVLNSMRESALSFIETGQGDPRSGLFEWSSRPGADPTDVDALAMANPGMGYRIDAEALLGDARRALAAGGEQLAGFRTEIMCQRVTNLDPALDPDRWTRCGTGDAIDLAQYRKRVALCLDVALDGSHATLMAAAVVDGKVHAEVVEAWEGHGCTKAVRTDLPGIARKVDPAVVGWFPMGPAAALAADLAEQRGPRRADAWPPRGVKVEEIRGEVTAVCMGLAEQVVTEQLVHPRDPLLDKQAEGAEKLRRGDAWVFGRGAGGAVDAVYALAGAVHLVRTLPPPRSTLVAL